MKKLAEEYCKQEQPVENREDKPITEIQEQRNRKSRPHRVLPMAATPSTIEEINMTIRQNAVLQPPYLFGHLIDLQKLYNEVALRGGHKQDFDQFLKSSRQNIYGASVRFNTEEIPNHLRKSWNLSIDLKDDFEYISLEKSLLSGLPNEIELALNTILLMSSQPNDFSISKNPRLLDVLLYTVGIYGPKKLPEVIYDEFCYPPAVQEMTYGDEEAFRVQLVATVLRNLAVDDGLSAVIIGRNPQALRFIFLCIYSKHSCLHQLGLEILSSLYFPVLGSLIPALHRLLTTLLVCPDRIDRIRGKLIIKFICYRGT
ncbi:unnamed protein product [Schistosoma mattheei]|uniref:Uncharacterized protein n=1 Tax=Schistosoma mattheei TaxID=31246 RepID=A0A183PMB0_9TREM|nr:unnamed protein product [Schistosoma mattheei]